MKAPAFRYLAPATLAEALRLLAREQNARVLAGGQSLVAMLNMRFAFPTASSTSTGWRNWPTCANRTAASRSAP